MTVYNPSSFLSVSDISNIYDEVLGRLDEAKEISYMRDSFYFVAFGFGTLILQNFLAKTGH